VAVWRNSWILLVDPLGFVEPWLKNTALYITKLTLKKSKEN